MAEINTNQAIYNALNTSTSAQAGTVNQTKTENKPKGNIGKEEFLTMLVTQLQNQDPLDPMSNEDFAVNLAQFSSLEQLISINDNVTAANDSKGELSSYASFLGKEVSVASDEVSVEDNDAGMVNFTLPSDARSVTIDLLNEDGSVAKSFDVGELNSGRQRVALTGLDVADGDYKIRVEAKSASGSTSYPETNVGGVVTGFVPGDSPMLLVGGKEIPVADVSLVQNAVSVAG